MIKTQYDVNAEVDARLEALEDKKLHENEIGFDMLCEKYVDDCAMKFAAVLTEQFFLKNYKHKGTYKDLMPSLAEASYHAAEAMLKEKLKRKNERQKI
jgi:hypothetical protein